MHSERARVDLAWWRPFALAVVTMAPAGFVAQRLCAHAADALEALLLSDPDGARRAVERALYGSLWVAGALIFASARMLRRRRLGRG